MRDIITTDPTDIKEIVMEYYEKQYANKLDNLNEVDIFLKIHKPSMLNQEEINNLNNLVSIQEISYQKEIPGPEGFPANPTKILRKKYYQFYINSPEKLKKTTSQFIL